ncbi:MAG: MATE family efflux transporter [Bacilli bacterium]|jgi:putative MATE family efflux protein|nr:MATE family efflux transporter [Bacilli bacterium]MCH4228600.1 MATE family efflux transporter [Bacilli bacterium]MCH4277725.1 MATE family efflux transporter [Bacilli bacterium]
MKTKIQLSDHFTYPRLLRFVLPSILMMVCTSLYSIVDGVFISNFAGKTAFAAVNLMAPILMGVSTVGFMIGTGGSAIVSEKFGEGKKEEANANFSFLVYSLMVLSFVLALIGFFLTPSIATWLGADGELKDDCFLYGRILFIGLPFFALQVAFQSFFVVAEKPKLSFLVNLIAGLTNALLDYLFIGVAKWGLEGAAIASVIGQAIGGLVPVIYFLRKNSSILRLGKARFSWSVLGKTCSNGSSEMVSDLASSLVSVFYNHQLLSLAGQDGVAAYGVMMYSNIVFAAIFIGYAIGMAPLVSYHFGAKNNDELRNLYKKSLFLMVVSGFAMASLSEALSYPLVYLFTGYDANLTTLAVRGFRLFSLSFLFMGVNIFGSAFFTALNNGLISALISFLRTLLFQTAAVFLLPLWLGIDGVWLAAPIAEFLACLLTVFFFIGERKRYHYEKPALVEQM